jgi:formylglycine-generating enzyme required for sulfatase activity
VHPSARPLLVLGLGLAIACASRTSNRAGGGSMPRWVQLQPRAPSAGAAADGGASVRCPPSAVYLPGGTFQMGSPEGVGAPDEHPAHLVRLSPYCIDRTEVPSEAYTRCVTAGACTRTVGSTPPERFPISGVDWGQALAYCRFTGGRLPTEAEWEFAARGAENRVFPWGSTSPSGCSFGDWTPGEASASCGGVGPSAVGSYPQGASAFGVLDLAGNVWEWTADWYSARYDNAWSDDPTGPSTGSARVTRGGGWNNDQPDRLRTAFREGQHPSFRDYDLGVRCAYDPIP